MDNAIFTVCKICKAWIMYDKDLDENDIPKLCIGCQKIEDEESVG